MSTFDDAFDANGKLSRSVCGCGQHWSVEEHNKALTLRCETPEVEIGNFSRPVTRQQAVHSVAE